jgi:ubiquitin-protein ligase
MDFRITRGLLAGADGAGGRLATEKRILADHFPQFTLSERDSADAFAVATGSLETFTGKSYRLRIVLAKSFPHSLPTIQPSGWVPRTNPHLIRGGLCVMTSSQWTSFMSTAFIVAKSALWLNKYEVFLDRGIWPGPEQHSHGPIYNVRKRWHEL